MDVSVASFILLSILTLEAGNSLINPSEGLFLAHQPINGVTYVESPLVHEMGHLGGLNDVQLANALHVKITVDASGQDSVAPFRGITTAILG